MRFLTPLDSVFPQVGDFAPLGGGSVPKILSDTENYAALRLSTTPTQAFAQFVGRYPPPPRATILPAQRS